MVNDFALVWLYRAGMAGPPVRREAGEPRGNEVSPETRAQTVRNRHRPCA
jgi:hypothetical protein